MSKLRHLLIIGVCTLILIVACSRPPDSPTSDKPNGAESCRLVEHDGGQTEICGQPQTIVALSPRVLDVMLALDVQPAAYAEAAYTDRKVLNLRKFDNPRQQIPHLGDRITTQPINLGHRNTPSLETLVEVKPDLIVAETWQENEPNDNLFTLASYDSDIAALLEELGFKLVLLEDLPETTDNSFVPQISLETLASLDPDIILVTVWDTTNFYHPEAASQRQWETTPLLQSMRAVKEGRIHFVNGQLWGGSRSGPIAYGIMLDRLLDLLLPFLERKSSVEN